MFQNSMFCPKDAFACSVWISEQTAAFALHNIHSPVFITKVESVYCTILTGSFSNTDLVFLLNRLPLLLRASRAMGQGVSRRPLRSSGFNPRSDLVTFLMENIISPMLHVRLHLHAALTRRKAFL